MTLRRARARPARPPGPRPLIGADAEARAAPRARPAARRRRRTRSSSTSTTAPVFDNIETPEGRRQTLPRRFGRRSAVGGLPPAGGDARSRGLRSRRRRGRGRLGGGSVASRRRAAAGRGSCATLRAGRRRDASCARAVRAARAAELVGVSHDDVDPATSLDDLRHSLPARARPSLVTRGASGRPGSRLRSRRTAGPARRYPAIRVRRGGRPHRCRRHVPRRAPRREASTRPATASRPGRGGDLAVRRGRRLRWP